MENILDCEDYRGDCVHEDTEEPCPYIKDDFCLERENVNLDPAKQDEARRFMDFVHENNICGIHEDDIPDDLKEKMPTTFPKEDSLLKICLDTAYDDDCGDFEDCEDGCPGHGEDNGEICDYMCSLLYDRQEQECAAEEAIETEEDPVTMDEISIQGLEDLVSTMDTELKDADYIIDELTVANDRLQQTVVGLRKRLDHSHTACVRMFEVCAEIFNGDGN